LPPLAGLKSRFKTSLKVARSREARRPNQKKRAATDKIRMPTMCPLYKTTAPKIMAAALARKATTAQHRKQNQPKHLSKFSIGFLGVSMLPNDQRNRSDGISISVGLRSGRSPLKLFGRSDLFQAFRQPYFDHGFTRNAHAAGLAIEGVDHPGWKIDIHPALFLKRPASLRKIKRSRDIVAMIEIRIEAFSLHKSPPLRAEIDERK
jgi:hypothetical protein